MSTKNIFIKSLKHKLAYHHATDELEHKRIVTHDLKSIGLLNPADLEQLPLPETEALTTRQHQ